MGNHLAGQTSPYLLQHLDNPVDWYPWCSQAFEKAKREDKPIFLSIGYSTCHWCHVMAHESFENSEIAEILNRYFVCIKVDKEERPDIDSIYMPFCQAFTGGGWPMSIFMTAEQKPFYAGTYFPNHNKHGMVGLPELLLTVSERWETDRKALLDSAEGLFRELSRKQKSEPTSYEPLIEKAVELFRRTFDKKFGGFGSAPKFPTPHNLMFLLQYYQKTGAEDALKMAETTLIQMYKGGMFDHIGYGFCRYSTDREFLVPHFEKMLCDNAMLILAYVKAFEITGKEIYKKIAAKTAEYVMRELRAEKGGFFSAQDADSDGKEGKFYVFKPDEIVNLLGEQDGKTFNSYYGITSSGNFEGRSIPNLLNTDEITDKFDVFLPKIRDYRKMRTTLHTDDEILTLRNSLMIAALCSLYRITGERIYLSDAKNAQRFIEEALCEDDTLFVSYRDGKCGHRAFADDYAAYIFALTALFDATLERPYLSRAQMMTMQAVKLFFDEENGGFFMTETENEKLILRPMETYDSALPSANSLMSWNLMKLDFQQPEGKYKELLDKQLRFMSGEAQSYPAGYTMFLMALSDCLQEPMTINIAVGEDELSDIPLHIPSEAFVRLGDSSNSEYRTVNEQTMFYVCANHSCLPVMDREEFYNFTNSKRRQTI